MFSPVDVRCVCVVYHICFDSHCRNMFSIAFSYMVHTNPHTHYRRCGYNHNYYCLLLMICFDFDLVCDRHTIHWSNSISICRWCGIDSCWLTVNSSVWTDDFVKYSSDDHFRHHIGFPQYRKPLLVVEFHCQPEFWRWRYDDSKSKVNDRIQYYWLHHSI